MLWRTGPSAAELEQRTTDWVRQMIGLPAGWFGVVTDLASTSTLYALAAAREADPALDVRRKGLAGRDLPRLRKRFLDGCAGRVSPTERRAVEARSNFRALTGDKP